MSQFVVKFAKWTPLLFGLVLLVGCGEDQMLSAEASDGAGFNDDDMNNDPGSNNGTNQSNEANDDDFIPEEEEFVVQQVAATESYVFVPNQTDDSDTVALIDGWDFSVHPMQVGLEPTQVVAADVEGQGSVGYVLSKGEPTVAIVRADQGSGLNGADVRLLPVPWEVNQLTISPDGRHVLAYIDPTEPINDSASTASLQTMALIRLGDEPGEDEVFHLSVTRLIDDIAFSEDSTLAFVVGREGINRLPLNDIKADAFFPPLDLDMASSVFAPQDQEVAFSNDGSLLAMRTSQYAGVGLFELNPDEAVIDDYRLIDLDGIPTDLDLVERDDGTRLMVATIRDQQQVVLFDIDEAIDADEEDDSFLRVLDAPGVDAGIGRLTPDESAMVIFSTLPQTPTVGLLDLESETIETFELRNQIKTVAISPDSETAVVVHRPEEGQASSSDPEEKFRHSEAVTIWDLQTGYRRPIGLRGEPEEILMTTDVDENPFLYLMLTSSNPAEQGVKKIDLSTHRTDFVRLPRRPLQLGVVAEQVFVSQEESTGRITFFDVTTNDQRTVSGYELNAGIE